MRWLFRTTRGRLTLLSSALLVVGLIVLNVGLDIGFSYSQRAQSSDELQAQAQAVASGIDLVDGHATYRGRALPSETSRGRTVDLAVVGSQAVVGKSPEEPLSDPTLRGISGPTLRSGRPLSVDLYDVNHVHLLVYALPVVSDTGEPLVLVASTPLAQAESSSRDAALALALFSLLMLLLLGSTIYALLGRVLRPVGQIARLARTISEQELDRRLEVAVPDDEMAVLVSTFNQMLARLESSFDALRSFTADAAHELRAPLSIVATEVEVALNRPRRRDEYVQVLRIVEAEVAEMSRMADRLLLLARADAGVLRAAPEDVDVADFVHETAARWDGPAGKRTVKLKVDAPDSGVLRADRDFLRRILDNLIDNAVRHSPSGGTVAIEAAANADAWVFEVKDNGPGIPTEERDRIFRRFARRDRARARSEPGGAGLGLALSSAFAATQGGAITVEDVPGWGAVFRLTLPQVRRTAGDLDQAAAAPKARLTAPWG